MAFSFSITASNRPEELDIGRMLPGFWDSLEPYRNPSINTLITNQVTDFEGWNLPWYRVEMLYAGVVAINALRPTAHILFPEEDTWPGTSSEGYWRLFNQYDIETEEQRKYLADRVTWAAVEDDLAIAAKVQYLYKKFILNGMDGYSAGDIDGELSVYFWNFMRELESWLEPLFTENKGRDETSRAYELRFHGGN